MGWPKRTCSVEGCTRPHRGRGWCNLHLQRWQKTGAVTDRRGSTEPARVGFWSNVERGRPYQCWQWLGYITESGYGSYGKNSRPAHRIAFETVVGQLPAWAEDLHHVCRNRGCVNPAHLLPMTHRAHRILHNQDLAHRA